MTVPRRLGSLDALRLRLLLAALAATETVALVSDCSVPAGVQCQEGDVISTGSQCTPVCPPGFLPSVSGLLCRYSVLSPASYTCSEAPCQLPGGIEHFTSGRCVERTGGSVAHGERCTPQCDAGFSPSTSPLACSLGVLTPSTFTCVGAPCAAPSGIAHASLPACNEWSTPNGMYCMTQCEMGYRPTRAQLLCTMGLFSPVDLFECEEIPCDAPTGIQNAASPSCEEGAIVTSNTTCTAKCSPGYGPSLYSLGCRFGDLTPKTFTCIQGLCSMPLDIVHAADPPCKEGFKLQDRQVCSPQCVQGYHPSVVSLSCAATVMSPKTFTCLGNPCLAPLNVANAMRPSCSEGASVSHGASCTPACAAGYTASETSLSCSLGVLSPASFACTPSKCPVPTNVSNAAAMPCDTPSIAHGVSCTPKCAPGYLPTGPPLVCSLGVISPPSFECVSFPCIAPETVKNAATPSCAEGLEILHGGSCTTKCSFGYTPSVVSLVCSLGVLAPSDFTCVGNVCAAPDSRLIPNAPALTCLDGPVVQPGEICISVCLKGYRPSVPVLRCEGEKLSPPLYSCLPDTLFENVVSVEDDTLEAGVTTNFATTSLGENHVLACYEESAAMRTKCAVLLGSMTDLQRGHAVTVAEDRPVKTVLVSLGESGRGLMCYISRDKPSGRCVLLGVSGFGLAVEGELPIADEGIKARHVVALPLTAASAAPHGAALLCYQKGALATVCRVFRVLPRVITSGRPAVNTSCEPITTQAECLAAAQLVNPAETSVNVVNLPLLPSGCSVQASAAFLNQMPSTEECSTTYGCVCRNSVGGLAAGEEFVVSNGSAMYHAAVALHSDRFALCFALSSAGRRGLCSLLLHTGGLTVVPRRTTNLTTSALSHVALSQLGATRGLACFSDWADGERGRCSILSLEGNGSTLKVGDASQLSDSITRYTKLVPLSSTTVDRAIDRVMAYYQLAVRVGHSPTMATPVSVDGDSVIVGSAAEVTSGIAWGLDLAPLTADSALACYADTSASEHGRCRVVWSPSYAPQDEPFVCSGGSECRKIFTAPPPELPGEVQNLATSNPSLGVVHVSWAIAIINVRAPEIYRYELSNDNFNTSIVEVANSATSYTFTSEFPIERRPYSVRSINIAGYSPVQQEFVRADYIGCATRASLLAMHSLNFQTVVLGAASSRDACRLACRAECMRNFGIFGHDAGAGTAKCVCGNMTNVPTVPGCALCALSGDETASGCGDASGSLVSIYDSGTPVRVVIPPMDWFHDYAVTATYEEPLGGYPVVNIKNDSWTQSWLGGTPPVTVFFDAGRPVIVEGFRTKMGPDANLKSYRDFIVKCQTTSNPADAYTVSAGTGGDHTEENGYYWNEYWFDDKTTCQRWQFVMTNSHKPGDGVGIQAFDFYATEEVCV
eukprot:TRINITY_DN21270_c1_g7_i3.p1 TRINITY_DN21270_c1_g7~~TRINITY_DN21270_c1_g7_i3.p1  ORF type:complete len:1400 (+),score=149.64 TRINITY_DN21270_c1_g7_i3:206-4405(+)